MQNYEYGNLIHQYKNLSEDERKNLLIYNSCFFYLINEVSSIPNFMELDESIIVDSLKNKSLFSQYRKFGIEINRLENLVLKYSVFSEFDFNDPINLVSQVKKVYNSLSIATKKIVTNDDLNLYRMVSFDKNGSERFLSLGNFISTSIDFEKAKTFMKSSDDFEHILYKIRLESASPCLVSPYSIVNEYNSEYDKSINNISMISIKRTVNNGQKEVILLKEAFDFDILNVSSDIVNGNKVKVIELSAKPKNNNKIKMF